MIRLSLALLCVAVPLFASGQKRVTYGFRAGASFANFYNHNASGQMGIPVFNTDPNGPFTEGTLQYRTGLLSDMRTGFFGGAYLQWSHSPHWSFEAGVNYAQKGISLKSSDVAISYESNGLRKEEYYEFYRVISSNYLTVPLVFKYYPKRGSKLFLLGGCYTAFLLSSGPNDVHDVHMKTWYDQSNQVTGKEWSVMTTTRVERRTANIGLMTGFGYNFPSTRRWALGLDLRCNMDITRTAATKSIDQSGFFLNLNKNARNLTFEAGIRFFRQPTATR